MSVYLKWKKCGPCGQRTFLAFFIISFSVLIIYFSQFEISHMFPLLLVQNFYKSRFYKSLSEPSIFYSLNQAFSAFSKRIPTHDRPDFLRYPMRRRDSGLSVSRGRLSPPPDRATEILFVHDAYYLRDRVCADARLLLAAEVTIILIGWGLTPAYYITLCILRFMFLIRRLTVASDMLSACCISISEYALTRRLKTASSSSVKLHSRRKRSHSGSVNSVLMFRLISFS